MITIEVVLGDADCKAWGKGSDYDKVTKEFDTPKEAKAYILGLNDANGYLECGVFIPEDFSLTGMDVSDLYMVQFMIPA